MDKVRRLIVACALCIIFATGTAFTSGGAAEVPRGPSGCPPIVGMTTERAAQTYVCFTIAQEGARQKRILVLEDTLKDFRFDLKKAKALKLRRVGWNVGPGGGLDFDGDLSAGVYVTFAWRIR